MNCPGCGAQFARSLEGGVPVHRCPACGSLWLLDGDFKEIRESRDRFVRWLDPDLWSDPGAHEVWPIERKCPGCGAALHAVKYAGSDISIDICPPCKGVWLDRGELDKVVAYLESIVDSTTVGEYLRSIGHEAAEALTHQKRILSELRNLRILMQLLEYRIVSRFPALSRIAAKLPPV